VNFLWVCLMIIVVGSFAGQWLAVMQKLGLEHNFWFGHQGWEYVDMGRFWQWFLFVGLLLWLTLVGRALWPAAWPGAGTEVRSSACCSCRWCHRPVLRRRPDVGRAHAPVDGRVLALVGGAPVGGRLLRGVRHRGDRLPVHPPGPAAGGAPGTVAVLFATIVFMAAACWAPCTTCTSPARRPR
jgi:hypothetical protein